MKNVSVKLNGNDVIPFDILMRMTGLDGLEYENFGFEYREYYQLNHEIVSFSLLYGYMMFLERRMDVSVDYDLFQIKSINGVPCINSNYFKSLPDLSFIVSIVYSGPPFCFHDSDGTWYSWHILIAFAKLDVCEPIKDVSRRMTYVMKDLNTNLYKIGKSYAPEKRLNAISAHVENVKLLMTKDSDIESDLHKEFQHKHAFREWYRLNDDDLSILINDYGFTLS